MNSLLQPASTLATVPAGESSVRSVEGRPSLQAAAGPPFKVGGVVEATFDLGYAAAVRDVSQILLLSGVVTFDALERLLMKRGV